MIDSDQYRRRLAASSYPQHPSIVADGSPKELLDHTTLEQGLLNNALDVLRLYSSVPDTHTCNFA